MRYQKEQMRITLLTAVLVAALVGITADFVSAQVRESTSYKMQSDSINFGGGLSTSTSYTQESTFGEVGTGDSSSASFNLGAGFQQQQSTSLSLTAATDVTMSPAIGGVTGGVANGSTSVTATTDNPAGYQLSITASASPALIGGGNSIADYVPATADPDFVFSTGSGEAHFGYSPAGTEIADRFKDNGAACNTGTGTTSLACWDGLSTTPEVIAAKTSGNHPNGTETTINFRVGIGGSVVQPEGTYTATTTLTLIAL